DGVAVRGRSTGTGHRDQSGHAQQVGVVTQDVQSLGGLIEVTELGGPGGVVGGDGVTLSGVGHGFLRFLSWSRIAWRSRCRRVPFRGFGVCFWAALDLPSSRIQCACSGFDVGVKSATDARDFFWCLCLPIAGLLSLVLAPRHVPWLVDGPVS